MAHMMKSVGRALAFSGLLVGVLSQPAVADPVTPRQVAQELENRGSTRTQFGIVGGVPEINGSLEDLGFTVRMRDCDEQQTACTRLLIRTCYLPTDFSRTTQLETVNTFNLDQTSVRAFVTAEPGRAQSMCIAGTYRTDLPGSGFGIRESDDWVRSVRAFKDHIEDTQNSRLAMAIIGKSAP